MSELAQRLASLSPEKLALLERQLKRRAAEVSQSPVSPQQRADVSSSLLQAQELPSLKAPKRAPEKIWTPKEDEVREIESVLEQHPGILEAAVTVDEATIGSVGVVAYLVPDQRSAGRVWQQLGVEVEALSAGRPWYRLPNGKEIVYLNRSETEFVYREIFEENSYLREGIVLKPGACIFDIGAHIGLFTLYASQQCEDAQIYAFEPIPTIFDVLRINTSLHAQQVKLFNIGLAATGGTDYFTYYPHASVLSGRYADLAAEFGTVKACLHTQQRLGVGEVQLTDREIEELLQTRLTTEQFSCPVKRLSQVMRENGIDRIDLLKIDVEKSELDVLKGIDEEDWPKIHQLVIEVHDIDDRLRIIRELLEKHGYQLTIEQDSVLTDTAIYNLYAVRPLETESALHNTENRQPGESNETWRSVEQLISDVRQFAEQKLSKKLVPVAFRLRRLLPRRPDGERDYSALAGDRSDAKTRSQTARNPLEEQLVTIWAETLRLDRPGVDEDFFGLGGNSLLAIEVVSRIQNALQVDVSLRNLFENPTIAGLAHFISGNQSTWNGGTNGVIAGFNGNGDETRFNNLSGLSDSEVEIWLKRLTAEKRASADLTGATPLVDSSAGQKEPNSISTSSIIRTAAGHQETLSANVNRLSDEDVDYWLHQLIGEEGGEVIADDSAMPGKASPDRTRQIPSFRPIDSASPSSSRTQQAHTAPSFISSTAGHRTRFEEVYTAFARNVQKIGWDIQKRSGEAYLSFIRDLQEAWIEGQEYRHVEASFTYQQSLQAARVEARMRFAEVYREYIQELRETWIQLDPETLDLDSLMAISRTMEMAAFVTNQTLMQWAMAGW